ncbi:hypothetical protein [Arthrobacter sp. UYCu712]|uniref:hypothetical protein n=1 Tax=Arthrobacter sp. UYCu712 TaxID=3156340 RepID=UPI00339748FA
MAGSADKVAGAFKAGGAHAKAVGAKAYGMATDPAVQAKAKRLYEDGAKIYRAANSPEAKKALRQVAEVLKKIRKK